MVVAQLVVRQSAVREVEGTSPSPNKKKKKNNWLERAAFVIISTNG